MNKSARAKGSVLLFSEFLKGFFERGELNEAKFVEDNLSLARELSLAIENDIKLFGGKAPYVSFINRLGLGLIRSGGATMSNATIAIAKLELKGEEIYYPRIAPGINAA